ncbi:MAG: hypothetical protein PHV32_05325, partial [Eubacteriales bacterium]|nr:hypothetical protein [Eubacteriales bacterium]
MRRPYVLILIAFLVFTAASCQGSVGNVALMPILNQQVFGLDAQDVHTILPTYEESSADTRDVTTAVTTHPHELTTSFQPARPEELIISEAYQQLPFFYPDNIARYIAYKAGNPDWDCSKVILYVNIGLDNPFYTHIATVKDTDVLSVVVNKYHKLPSDYVPVLVELPQSLCTPGAGRQYLQENALEAFEKMHDDAEALGLDIT